MQYSNDLKGLKGQTERLTLLMRDYEDKYQKALEMRDAVGSDNVDNLLELLTNKVCRTRHEGTRRTRGPRRRTQVNVLFTNRLKKGLALGL